MFIKRKTLKEPKLKPSCSDFSPWSRLIRDMCNKSDKCCWRSQDMKEHPIWEGCSGVTNLEYEAYIVEYDRWLEESKKEIKEIKKSLFSRLTYNIWHLFDII